MNRNMEKFLSIVSNEETQTVNRAIYRVENRKWLKASKAIAIEILFALDKLGITQKDFAEKLGVSPQYVNKLVKGSENLTLETIIKIQEILNIEILASLSPKETKNTLKVQFTSPETVYNRQIYQNYNSRKCNVINLVS